MTDAEKMFRQTSKERKNSRGVWAKKSGSRSKRCSLPSDNLTAKQRKELNGAVETINTMKILSYDEWKVLSKSMKELYLEALFSQHNARVCDVAAMWGHSDVALREYAKRQGIDLARFAAKSRAYKKRSIDESWLAFLENSRAVEIEDLQEPVEEENVQQEAPESVKQQLPKGNELLRVISGVLSYEGDPAAIFQKALLALDPSKSYTIQIAYQTKESK